MMAGRGIHGGTDGAGGPVRHIPVLLRQLVKTLSPEDNGLYIDATFGAGGYTRAILEAAGGCRVLAIDRDPDAILAGQQLVNKFSRRLTLKEGRFSNMQALARAADYFPVDGIVLDIGVSSMQLDEAARGFSFQKDGPLDMRMSRSGPSAADVVNNLAQADLARILKVLGEERRAGAIARAIVNDRVSEPFTRTKQLADLVQRLVGRRHDSKTHPATRTFQALRIFVNHELEELAGALGAAQELLKPGGVLAVVTFHSLEDRIVKRFFLHQSGRQGRPSRHLPEQPGSLNPPGFQNIYKKPVTPDEAEKKANPRARSARLRAARRTDAAAQTLDFDLLGLPKLPPGP